MTSNKNGDDSVTDAAASGYEALTDDSAALSWAGDDVVTDAADTALAEAGSAEAGREFGSPTELDAELALAYEAGVESAEAVTAAPAESDPVPEPAPTAVEPEPEPEPAPAAVEPELPAREPLSNASLVFVGLLAGVYLLYSIGWYIGAGRIDSARGTLLTDIGFHAAFWLAVALPPLWFTASMLGTKKKWTRMTALLIGVVLCVPWPFVMVGALGV